MTGRVVSASEATGIRPGLPSVPAVAPVAAATDQAHFRTPWRQAITGAVATWLAVRALLTAYAVILVSTQHVAPTRPAVPQSFFTLFYRWDSSYYLEIAQRGYFSPLGPAHLDAFLPGYPLAARVMTAALFPGTSFNAHDVTVGLWAVSAIASLVGAVGLWRVAADRFGGRVAFGATVLLLAGPYSVFLAASYSESLFLAFAVFAWYHAARGRWVTSGLLAAAASFTRIDGLFLAAALGALYLHSARSGGRGSEGSARQTPGLPFHLRRAAGLVALAASTVVGYFVYLFAVTSDPLAWFTAEHAGWHRRFTMPWLSGVATAAGALNPHAASDHRAQSLLEVVFAVLCIAGAILLARRRRWGAVVLVVAVLASLMTSTTYLSLSRESLVLFPLTVLVASLRDVPAKRWVFRIAVVASLALFAFNAHQFVLGLWAQ